MSKPKRGTVRVTVHQTDEPVDLDAWARIAVPILLELARERLAKKDLARAA